MAHDYEKNIKCPYCDNETEDDEYDYCDADGEEKYCDNCNETFCVTSYKEITYSTKKSDCKNKHDYYEKITEISQETCDRWNKGNLCSSNNYRPHKIITRCCNNCDIEHIRSEY